MVQLSMSSFRVPEGVKACLLAALLALSACASREAEPEPVEWPEDGPGTATSYLHSLRDYLTRPGNLRRDELEQLRLAAEAGDRYMALEYAFALSTSRNDVQALNKARMHFEALLASPDPLPVELDGLVRLQLTAVIDRLERINRIRDQRAAEASCLSAQQQCAAQRAALQRELDAANAELRQLREKLEALARIEQTVNETPEETDTGNGDANETADSAGRR